MALSVLEVGVGRGIEKYQTMELNYVFVEVRASAGCWGMRHAAKTAIRSVNGSGERFNGSTSLWRFCDPVYLSCCFAKLCVVFSGYSLVPGTFTTFTRLYPALFANSQQFDAVL